MQRSPDATMDIIPSSSAAPPYVRSAPPQRSFTHANGRCLICHSFVCLRGYLTKSRHPWDEIIESARHCVFCDVIVRGCRGWLNANGKEDWIPNSLLLQFEHVHTSDKLIEPYSKDMVAHKQGSTSFETHSVYRVYMGFHATVLPMEIFMTERE